MSAVVPPAITYPVQQGGNRNQVITWGLPTKVAYPGSANGNTPPADPNDTADYPTWATIKSGDTCTPVFCPALTDRSLQVTGTTGSGGTITLQGSNDGVNYVTLTDVLGNALSGLTPNSGIVQINQQCQWIKPLVVSGDGTTSLNVIVNGKKPF